MSPWRPTAALLFFSFLSRSHSDPRLAPVLLLLQFPLEESFRPSFGISITILAVSSRGVIQTLVWHPVFILRFREDYRLTSLLFFPMHCYLYVRTHWLICSYASCLHLLYLMSELSCEYFHSTHLACWFGQMLTKAISWMKSLIVSPTPRGIPVSPVRSWILVTCIIYASATHNKNPRASLRCSKSC